MLWATAWVLGGLFLSLGSLRLDPDRVLHPLDRAQVTRLRTAVEDGQGWLYPASLSFGITCVVCGLWAAASATGGRYGHNQLLHNGLWPSRAALAVAATGLGLWAVGGPPGAVPWLPAGLIGLASGPLASLKYLKSKGLSG